MPIKHVHGSRKVMVQAMWLSQLWDANAVTGVKI